MTNFDADTAEMLEIQVLWDIKPMKREISVHISLLKVRITNIHPLSLKEKQNVMPKSDRSAMQESTVIAH
jgi:hypothetical protein